MRENTANGAAGSGGNRQGEVGAGRERRRRGPAPRALADRLWERVEKRPDGCWIYTGLLTPDGYGSISKGGHCGRMVRAHRAAWELERGAIPAGLVVCHRCDVRACCNPAHLFLGTQSDNMQDCAAKGRLSTVRFLPKNRGEANGRAKLTRERVEEIRSSPLSASDAALAFGVSRATVHAIRQRRIWRDAA